MSSEPGLRQELVTNPPGVAIVTVIAIMFGVVGLGKALHRPDAHDIEILA